MSDFDDLKIREDEEMITAAQHEKEMTRMETANRRWFISFLVVLSMLFASNLAWVVYESQFQDVTITQEADTAGGDNYLNATGEFSYGSRETNDQNQSETDR